LKTAALCASAVIQFGEFDMKRIIVVLFVISSILNAQDYDESANWIFFGRQPSAKTESMGRIVALDYDNNFLSQSNPASLISSKGISVYYSQSSNLYLVENFIQYSGGISYNAGKLGAFAFNVQLLDWGEFDYASEGSPEVIGTFRSTDELYTLSYSNNVYNWFSVGVNANLLKLLQGPNNSASGSTYFDIGLLRKFNLFDDSVINDCLTIGGQIKNVFGQEVEIIDIGEESYYETLPIIFNIGISNKIEYFNKSLWERGYLIGLTLGFEYQGLFNSEYRTAKKFGGELSVLDVLYFRGGYYYEIPTENDNCLNCLGYIENTTFGFGVNIDFETLFKTDYPLTIKIDYIDIPQPTQVTDFDSWDNFQTISLIANYIIK